MGRKSKKTEILAVSKKLFSDPGIEKVKVIDICKKAGISKVTFYKHFRNKEDLVKYQLNKMFEQDILQMRKIEAASSNFHEEINGMINYEVNERDMEFYTVNSDYLTQNPNIKPHMDYIVQKRLEEGRRWIDRGQKRGRIKADVKPEFILVIFQKLFEIIENKELLGYYKNGRELMHDIDRFFFYGIVGERE